jgi:hypothetical protein
VNTLSCGREYEVLITTYNDAPQYSSSYLNRQIQRYSIGGHKKVKLTTKKRRRKNYHIGADIAKLPQILSVL